MRSILLTVLICSSSLVFANENSLLDFSSIKDLIKQDGLDQQLEKKEQTIKAKETKKINNDVSKYNFPKEGEFWKFISEYWLIKNANKLKWDFQKPDFDLENALKEIMETHGFFEQKFKILLIDTTELVHAALPANEKETIFLISHPFIKGLDLSKVEIALLMFEDFLRLRKGYLKSYVEDKDLLVRYGSNFKDKPLAKDFIPGYLKKISDKFFEKGFSFQQQFEVTMEMNSLLKSNSVMWTTYYKLIEKIDISVKENILYKNYSQIYPSPELQKNWLKPNNTRI